MITKVMISDFFGVSRSAVSQSTTKRDIISDLELRIRRFLLCKGNMMNVGYSKDQLIKIVRLVIDNRSTTDKATGRPKQNVSFIAIRQMIYRIFKDICNTLNVKHTEEDLIFQFTIPFVRKMKQIFTIADMSLFCLGTTSPQSV